MNLLKSTLLASLVAAAANAQEEEPSIPNLNGQNFKITVRKYMQTTYYIQHNIMILWCDAPSAALMLKQSPTW